MTKWGWDLKKPNERNQSKRARRPESFTDQKWEYIIDCLNYFPNESIYKPKEYSNSYMEFIFNSMGTNPDIPRPL